MIEPWRWRALLAVLNPVVGSEQAGTRPVLVVSEEDYNSVMPLVTILPLTSRKPGRQVYPNEVLLSQGVAGLTTDSIVLAHQVRTIAKGRLRKALGILEDQGLRSQVLEALKGHLGLEEEAADDPA